MHNKKESKVRRSARSQASEHVVSKLETTQNKHKLGRFDVARLMVKFGYGRSFTSNYKRLGEMLSGRYPGDEFAAGVLNTLAEINSRPAETLAKLGKKRVGLGAQVRGQSVLSRVETLTSDKQDKGRLALSRFFKQAAQSEQLTLKR